MLYHLTPVRAKFETSTLSGRIIISVSIPNKFVGYVGMAVVWLTVPTLLPKLLNVALLTDRH